MNNKKVAKDIFESILEGGERKMTNADRIRQMTDEELTRFLNGIVVHCIDHKGCTGCPMREGCCYDYGWMEKWMKQEVSEDAAD